MAVAIEHLAIVAALVADVNVAGAVDGQRGWPDELAIAVAEGGELTDVLLVDRADRDAQKAHLGVGHVRTAEDVESAVTGRRDVDRIIEAWPVLGQSADGVQIADALRSRDAHSSPVS